MASLTLKALPNEQPSPKLWPRLRSFFASMPAVVAPTSLAWRLPSLTILQNLTDGALLDASTFSLSRSLLVPTGDDALKFLLVARFVGNLIFQDDLQPSFTAGLGLSNSRLVVRDGLVFRCQREFQQ